MAGKRKTKLTTRQYEILEWIKEFMQEHDMAPTVMEIGDEFGMKSSSVFDHLKALERKGYITRKRTARSITLTNRVIGGDESIPVYGTPHEDHTEKNDFNAVDAPVVGEVAAGTPILAVENIVGHVKVDAKLARYGRVFALSVTGDSMVDAGINEGDLLIVRQQPVAESGDIVVALLDEEATVKRLYIREARIELRPANSKYKPVMIGPDDDLRICGKVVAVKRTAH